MRKEIEEVFKKVKKFQADIKHILENAGLVEKELTELGDDDLDLDDLDASGPDEPDEEAAETAREAARALAESA
jgi:3-deoxy-D-manno-octulosonate 8-phosphate phosphatase KdsC-like HAD superfamily phosphatase